MRRLILSLLPLSLLLLALPMNAENIVIESGMGKLVIDQRLEYLFDPEKSYQIGQILDPQASRELQWTPGNQRSNALIMSPGLYWFKGQLINHQDKPVTLTVVTDFPSIREASLYKIDQNNQLEMLYQNVGLDKPFAERPVPHRSIVNRLTLPAKSTTTLVWRVVSEPFFHFRVTLWDPPVFYDQDQRNQIFYGMIYGILVVMALYNLFLYFACRENSYLYYVLFISSAFYLMSADQGHIYQYVAPEENWAKLEIYTFAFILNLAMFSQFTISYLKLRQHSRPLSTALYALTAIVAITSIIMIVSNSMTACLIVLIASSLVLILGLIAGITVRRAGVISAGFYVIAVMILVFSLIASQMSTLGLIATNTLTESLPAIGTTLMLVFFSLALADRIRQLQKENNIATATIAKVKDEKLKTDSELLKSRDQRIKLEHQASQAKLESQAKSSFLSTMSQEVRAPMNSVLNVTEAMKSTTLSDAQAHFLNDIERASHSLLSIVNDLQDFAKIEAGEMELEVASFNLETLLDDCISTFSLRSLEKNLNFIADLEPSIPPVLKGDATKLRQIILNLLSNAFKFTDHGNILLSVNSTNKPAINSIELKFEVKDSGIGLTDEEQQRLFTPFHHADDSTFGRYGGSGLGLSISKQLADLMDGKIGVDSTPGKGSTFWFTARLLVDKKPDASLLREKSSKIAGKRLLLIDPNPVSADIICRLLGSWLLEVVSCNSVREAKQLISSEPFDVVLAEYYIENGNSLGIAKHIQTLGKNAPAFILMAATRNLKKQNELDIYNIEILLEKPITNALLHDAILRAITSPIKSLSGQAQQEYLSFDPQSLKVLVVEDNQVNQLVIKGLLKQLHIKPDIVANGLEAVSHAEQTHYDFILMDCELPEMDGYEACHQIRIKEENNNTRPSVIVALSAHARSDYKARAEQVGMDDFLTKPISLSELAAVMNKLLSQL